MKKFKLKGKKLKIKHIEGLWKLAASGVAFNMGCHGDLNPPFGLYIEVVDTTKE